MSYESGVINYKVISCEVQSYLLFLTPHFQLLTLLITPDSELLTLFLTL